MLSFVPIDDTNTNYLRDESRSAGFAEQICFPHGEDEVIDAVRAAARDGRKVTLQGARTGLTAAAVPYGGYIINLSLMKAMTSLRYDEAREAFVATVQPGMLLSQFNQMLERKDFPYSDWDDASRGAAARMKAGEWFFAPDPTETSATIGGMAACNASGAKTFFYGPTRCFILGLRMVLASGEVLDLRRGACLIRNRRFSAVTEQGTTIAAAVPDYDTPDVKCASGYYVREGMDLVDLIVGAEGTFGILTELTLLLTKRAPINCGVTVFMPNQDGAVDLVRALRGETLRADLPAFSHRVLAIEFFDRRALALLRNQQRDNPAFAQIQPIDERCDTAIYTEFAGQTEAELWAFLDALGTLVTALGGDEGDTWVAVGKLQMEKQRAFRHACPECVNMMIDQMRLKDPRITKLGTDMSVPSAHLGEIVDMYEADLTALGIPFAMFGHIGQNHLHVNVIPRDMEEYAAAKKLYLRWAARVSALGGAVSAEHGIGKLKVDYLAAMFTKEQIAQMRSLKRVFDPECQINCGNLFADEPAGE